MLLIKGSIKDPVTVIVGVLLVGLFGTIALFRFPIQLTPNVDVPTITVSTAWPDASPQEIERQIVKRQEEKLKNVYTPIGIDISARTPVEIAVSILAEIIFIKNTGLRPEHSLANKM